MFRVEKNWLDETKLGLVVLKGTNAMQAANVPQVLMQSTATWALGSLPSVLSTRAHSYGVNAGRQYLRGKWLQLWKCRLPPPVGTSLGVSGMGMDGKTTGTPRSQGNLRSQSSPSSVEGGEAGGNTEDELSVLSRFIDEQLLQTLNKETGNPVRQTVLMTDGTDTRPYRLLWPSPSLIFDVSPEAAFNATSRKQIAKGLKVPRSCLVRHVAVDIVQEDWGDDFVDNLLSKGYREDAPSVWVIEMPRAELSEFSLKGILTIASSLLMKGSTFFGVISCPSAGSSELETRALLERFFVGQGFSLKVLSYEELTSNSPLECSGVPPTSPPNLPFAFVAHQQRLSDAQVEYGQMQIALAEEVDEEGFEDGW